MNILITGANGFTGEHFVKNAKAKGYQVSELRSDLTKKEAVRLEIAERQFDAVVHLAAISFVGHEDEAAFYGINVVGTTNLLEALLSCDKAPKKVLLASSANVYGNCDSSLISEAQDPTPINHYAMSKLAMEYMARAYQDSLQIVIARPFNYTGRGQTLNFVIPKLVDHFKRKVSSVQLGNVNVGREFNDVRMVCDAYLALLEHGESGEAYNICTGKTYTLLEVINTLSILTGHSLNISMNPALVRSNEVIQLGGDPMKLQQLMSTFNIAPFTPELSQTLDWMLAE